MKFSQRHGYTPVSTKIQTDFMTDELRYSIWNALDINLWSQPGFMYNLDYFSLELWIDYFKEPVSGRPESHEVIRHIIEKHFMGAKWYQVYDFLEFVLGVFPDQDLTDPLNNMLERELAGYRIINGIVSPITGELEVVMLQQALADNDFPLIKEHLSTALELLSNRQNPDYRNSIKESISAVEYLARVIADNPNATLGQALNAIERSGKIKIHTALKEGYSKIYGYTSDQDGIRHSLMDEPNLTAGDAIFFLLSCTSFIGYLKSKM
jgi:AbiJ N-terminal domain 4